MQLRRVAMFAEWEDESALQRFLAYEDLGRLRRYGEVAAIAGLPAGRPH